MRRVLRTLGATLVVSTSMLLGATLALSYAWFIAPANGGGLIPVRLEAPLSRDGEATKAAIFDERQIESLYERAAPAVVTISSTTGRRLGLGSGALIDPSGVVLTNFHVVRGADRIGVALSDRTQYIGKVLGSDPQDDLAVVRLVDAPAGLPVIPLGDSDLLRPGALAVAIGNPNRLERSVTVGVISGLNRTLRETPRPLRNALQTDAAINPGNSGGPLLNSQGELIGINTAIEAVSGQRGFGGIGYAIPSTTIRRYLDRLLAGETVEHPRLGITGSDLTPAVARDRRLPLLSGALIDGTAEGGPAQLAGVRAGDVLVSIDGRAIHSVDDIGEQIEQTHRPGDVATLGIWRAGTSMDITVTLDAWPDSVANR